MDNGKPGYDLGEIASFAVKLIPGSFAPGVLAGLEGSSVVINDRHYVILSLDPNKGIVVLGGGY